MGEYITREDAGDIVCEATNGVGHDTARDVLALDVLYAPEVEMMAPHISCQATNNLGQGEAEADISYQWLQQELDLFKQEDEEVEDINNVRRNVRQEHSLPLTSSSSSVSAVSIFALSLLIFI